MILIIKGRATMNLALPRENLRGDGNWRNSSNKMDGSINYFRNDGLINQFAEGLALH